MKVKDIMTDRVIPVGTGETADVAARTLAQYDIGILPVCDPQGALCGLVTDRDLVIRCMAAGKGPGETQVSEIMTKQVVSVSPDTDLETAAKVMAARQLRRLPVTENGQLKGILSLGDLTRKPEGTAAAAVALEGISAPWTNGI